MISGSFNGARRVPSTSVRLPLDGTLRLTLRGPARSDFALEVLQGRRVLARTRTRGSADRLTGLFCRSFANVETVRVRVRRLSGGGAFRLRISYPG